MIGLGPRTMGVADRVFLTAVQAVLIALAVVALWLAVRATRGPG